MKKFAIYTAIVGNYDTIRQPLAVDERFDYYLFSNDIREDHIGVWKVRPIPYSNPIQTKIARWVKTHPEELLPGYECSLWLDANIQVASPDVYVRVVELMDAGVPMASMWHHLRNSILEEALQVVSSNVEHETAVYRWITRLRREHYPFGNDLYETGVLFRNHRDPRTSQADRLWWDCIDRYSKRDQLSFGYALWRTNIACTYFLPQGYNARNSTSFRYIPHDDKRLDVVINKEEDPISNFYCRLHTAEDGKNLRCIHSRNLRSRHPLANLKICGFAYRVLCWLKQ